MADQPQAAMQTVTADAQSQWTVGGNFSSGAAGTAEATIAGGSLLTVNGNVLIGNKSGASGALTVTGTGSLLQGDTLAVGGIADAAGGAGTLSIGSGGSVLVAAALVWPFGTISVGGSLEVQGGLSGDGTIAMAGGVLHLDAPGAVSAAVGDFTAGDTIDLKGITPDSVQFTGGS
jgi:T5SS/PEP-CTERM-associated repeat protein